MKSFPQHLTQSHEKCPSWESELELAEISAQTVRQFLEKSDRKPIWNGQ